MEIQNLLLALFKAADGMKIEINHNGYDSKPIMHALSCLEKEGKIRNIRRLNTTISFDVCKNAFV